MGTGGRSGEFELIERYFRPLSHPDYGLNLSDDAALLPVDTGTDLVLTMDTVISGVHYFPDDPPGLIAKKALRVNLSDLVAKGAEPVGYLMSLGLEDGWSDEWLEGFSEGLKDDQSAYGIHLLGGDTVRSPDRVSISITAIGKTGDRGMIRRSGGQSGDVVFATGTIGDSALGLRLRIGAKTGTAWTPSTEDQHYLIGRYTLPEPRVGALEALRAHAHAAMDISDGLVGDLGKLAKISGLGVELDVDAIPLSPAARAAVAMDHSLWGVILNGGDDYEILGTVAPESSENLFKALAEVGCPTHAIGTCRADLPMGSVLDRKGRDLTAGQGGFTHF